MAETDSIIEKWKARYERERAARKESERLLEQKSLQLYHANQQLQQSVRSQDTQIAEAQREIEKLSFVAKNAINGIAISNARGELEWVNEGFVRLSGYSQSEVIGKVPGHFLQGPETDPEAVETIRRSIQAQKPCEVDLINYNKVGKPYWVSLSISPNFDEAGNLVNFFAIQSDISERKRIQERLRELNANLESEKNRAEQLAMEANSANKAKSQFLANMSHELRTPLNSILGMTEGLLESIHGNFNDKQRTALKVVEKSGNHLLELINDILDMAKIDAGGLSLDVTRLVPGQLVDACLTIVRPIAAKKCISLQTVVQPSIPPIMADERRIRQVILNLLSNAIKFTPDYGRVKLSVSADFESSERGTVVIEIADNGIGINEADKKRIFEPFVQLENELSRQHEGTGLGLALVRRIVELHGGTIEVESTLHIGTKFTLSLPMEVAPGSLLQAYPEDPVARNDANPIEVGNRPTKSRILYVEDNEANIATLGSYLEAHGYELCVARHGTEALDLYQSSPPDLILSDIQLPGMSGYEIIGKIREIESIQDRHTPIIAVTAFAMPEDRDRCLQVGADDYMSKPLQLRLLVNRIQELLSPAT
jgi:PAS domain S-box-containing protein